MKTLTGNKLKYLLLFVLSAVLIAACTVFCTGYLNFNSNWRTAEAADGFDSALVSEWNSKVTVSTASNPQTFKLTKDWRAAANGFGEGTGFDSQCAGALCVPKGANIILDLNGFTLDRNLTSYVTWGCVISVDGSLTIKDSSSSGTGLICGGYNGNYGGAIVVNCGTLTIESGTISGNQCRYSGGGIYLVNSATATMRGGKITGNTDGGYNSSGVYIGSGGVFDMYGGLIEGGIDAGSTEGTKPAGLFNHVGGTVNGASVTLIDTTADVNVTYDGKAHRITVTATGFKSGDSLASRGTVKYGLSSGNYNQSTCPAVTDVADSKTIYYRVTFSNTYATFTGSAKITVKPRDISSGTSVSGLDDCVYTAETKEPSFTVTNSAFTSPLVKDKDYTVAYTNNLNAGMATVTLTGKGNFTGTASASFTITKAPLTDATQSVNAVYDGTPHVIAVAAEGFVGEDTFDTAEAVVKYGTTDGAYPLSESPALTDASASPLTIYYQLTFKNYQTITGSKTITVKPRDISSGTSVSGLDDCVYTAETKEPSFTVTNSAFTSPLVKDKDYTVAYTNNLNAGMATVTLTGKGNFTGTASASFTITKAPLTDATQSVNVVYDGMPHVITVTAEGFKGSDAIAEGSVVYSLSPDGEYTAENPAAVNVADTKTVYYKITFDNYQTVEGNVTLTITPKNIAEDTVITVNGKYEADGTAKIPEYEVVNNYLKTEDKTLVEGTDFTAEYLNNVNVGEATIKLTGKGNFIGEATQNFNIDKAEEPEPPVEPEPPKGDDPSKQPDSSENGDGGLNPAVIIVPVTVAVVVAAGVTVGLILRKRRK